MKIGLFFGSFNPIHIGHLIIANHLAQNSELDKIWFIISPQNPFKEKASLLQENHRYYMAGIATESNNSFYVSNIEFGLPKPSYTIDTLTVLKERYPKHTFSLIMGEDNLRSFHKWKNYEELLNNHTIHVYPRLSSKEAEDTPIKHPNIHFHADTPLMKISATFIRKCIKENKDISYLVPENVKEYIEKMHFYK